MTVPLIIYDRDVDLVVAGAGIIGRAVAYECARRGFRVRVFDARRLRAGATHASAGVLAPFIEAPAPGPLHSLTLQSFGLYDSFVAGVVTDAGMDVEFRRCGTLEVASNAADAERLKSVAEWARGAGVDAEWRPAESFGSALRAPTEFGGLLILRQGYVRVEQLMEALRRAAERCGAVFHEEEPIERIDPRRGGVLVHYGGRSVTCEAVVVAAGSWSDSIAPDRVAVRPVRGQLLKLHWRAEPLPHVIWSEDCYVVPWVDGSVLVGATIEDVGFDARVTANGVRLLLDAVCRLLPDAADATFLEARCGLRPASSDGLPVIRSSRRSPRVIYATGHYRNGILLAPLTSQLVADLLKVTVTE